MIRNREELATLLPHRGAMLLLDSLEIQADGQVRASYHVREDAWFLHGHFPGNPVVPGVMLCEIMAQACCGLIPGGLRGSIPYLVKIRDAAFRQPVYPGDTVRVEGVWQRNRPPLFEAACQAYVQSTLCAQAVLSFVLQPEEMR